MPTGMVGGKRAYPMTIVGGSAVVALPHRLFGLNLFHVPCSSCTSLTAAPTAGIKSLLLFHSKSITMASTNCL